MTDIGFGVPVGMLGNDAIGDHRAHEATGVRSDKGSDLLQTAQGFLM